MISKYKNSVNKQKENGHCWELNSCSGKASGRGNILQLRPETRDDHCERRQQASRRWNMQMLRVPERGKVVEEKFLELKTKLESVD